ncbi:hypothetical protein ACJJTC_010262 [Scirpophaga incertulas]
MSPTPVKAETCRYVLTSVTVLLVFCARLAEGDTRESRTVQTTQGSVRGYKDPNSDVFIYYGIPYASVPTGENKFKAPLPPPTWLTTLDAVDQGIICPQTIVPEIPFFYEGKQVREDCLIANIYTPKTNVTNLPVVVYVHGGAFQGGYGTMGGPTNMVQSQHFVAVTFNYRLGIHGFLCLGTETAPGNAGMKDMVALLKWVKANIASFGGNPVDVIINGYSAGSAAVELLMLSPETNGLFSKSIQESGGSLAAFAVQNDPISIAKDFAQKNNVKNIDNMQALEEFYKTATLDTLTNDSFQNRKDQTFVFAPCIEQPTLNGPSFLSDSPYNILKTGNYKNIPMLYGFCNLEGLIRIQFLKDWSSAMNDKFTDFLPPDLQFANVAERNQVAQSIKQFYFGNNTIGDATTLAYVDFFSDMMFIYPMIRSARLFVSTGHDKVYLYQYSFYDNDTAPVPFSNVRGAAHMTQTLAILDQDESKISEDFKNMKALMRETWGRFIKTGVPSTSGSSVPSWPKITSGGSPYMSLGRTVQLLNSIPAANRIQFWDNIYAKYYRPPSAPRQQPLAKIKAQLQIKLPLV